MPLSIEQLSPIARLARLELSAADAEGLRRDLEEILGHVERLAEVEVGDVAPTASPRSAKTPLRPDSEQGSLSIHEALANAPDASGGHFRVPRIDGG